MSNATNSVIINDDEVEFKIISVFLSRSKKLKQYTADRAEKLGLIKVDPGPIKIGNEIYSKSITLNNNNLKLCLSTNKNGK